MGFAMPLPAMSGAEPWLGSYRAVPLPSDAEASMPSEPVSMDASSERMSPNVFSVTRTSNWDGFATSCMAQLSTSMSSPSTSGYSSFRRWFTSRHSREVSSTFALSTEVTMPSRRPAASYAQRMTRSISYSEYSMVSTALSPASPATPAPSTPCSRRCSPKYRPPVSSRTMSRSTPSSLSSRSGDASRSASYTRTGRRLRYRPRFLRMASRPCSGRTAPGRVSFHFGPPTAASSTASDASAAASVADGSALTSSPASRVASIAAPPMSWSSHANSTSYAVLTASSSRFASAMISGPIPSPGSVHILYVFDAMTTSFGAPVRRAVDYFPRGQSAPATRSSRPSGASCAPPDRPR